MTRVAIGPDGKYMFASQIKDAENIGPEKEPANEKYCEECGGKGYLAESGCPPCPHCGGANSSTPTQGTAMKDDLVEITNVHNKAFRTYQKANEEGVYRLSPAEAFNELSHVPAKNIDLGDGRIVEITGWAPVGDIEYNGIGYIPVTITGYILRQPAPPKSEGPPTPPPPKY